ncbi:uncharacterized protein KY384_000030 [Bacidia gigantensis]|uniref:uncharacterized protein n=1 Tax=Bacidia gigantensis TaxID=2732470 RepID=UPI001D041F8C|nr:uncharacterized protein KY384_000030 [Bacidia gigantensis]KAG8526437.1 hypothetical protein KY384_000030 [Bacidia gigantensis]
MHQGKVILFAAIIAHVNADLTCLAWGLIVSVVGLICHIAPDRFHAAENATISDITNTVHEAKIAAGELLDFDLTHNPVAVGFTFTELAVQNRTGVADDYLAKTAGDFMDVGIGIVNETKHQIVQIYDMANWNDVSICLIRGGVDLARKATATARMSRRALSLNQAVEVAKSCTDAKVDKILHPAVLNFTDPNQKVGKTISDVAGLFAPVGVEAEAGAAAKAEFDLAIYGSEDTTRIAKAVDSPGTGATHFASQQEAEAVAEKLQDPSWPKANCRTCATASTGDFSLGKTPARRRRRLSRRAGTTFSFCCRVPPMPEIGTDTSTLLEQATEDSYTPDPGSIDPKDVPPSQSRAIYDTSKPIKYIPETDLVKPPALLAHDLEADGAEAAQGLKTDLSSYDVGLIPFSKAAQSTGMGSAKDMFATLRKAFTSGPGDALYDGMRVTQKDGTDRLVASSFNFAPSADVVKPLRAFADAALEDGKAAISALIPDRFTSDNLLGQVEFFWIPPSEKAGQGVDVRGLHFDGGIMQFAAADREGLVVMSSRTGEASRMPLADEGGVESWACMKASGYGILTGEQVTLHAVYGPDIVRDGRVSVVVSIGPMYLEDTVP